MLTAVVLDRILDRLPWLAVGVVGDLFLDQYLDLDPALSEPSLETGLDAHQIVGVRNSPGAAGTVLNNLKALGVGHVAILSVIGADANGFALKREMSARQIDSTLLLEAPDRHTPTYCKPLLGGRELNRLDLKNRTPTPPELEDQLLAALPKRWNGVQALIVLDQVSEAECGVVTTRVRQALADLGAAEPRKPLLADSRERLDLFRNCWLKANERELRGLPGGDATGDIAWTVRRWAERRRRPVFCTRGAAGILLAEDWGQADHKGRPLADFHEMPAHPVAGPIDIVGAGDSVSAGLACAVAAGATLPEAAAFANLVASITIQQLGTTGTATPAQVRARWQEAQRDG